MKNGKVIVVGNEKGGTGKSTLAMHLIVWFLRHGKSVSSVDLDGRQGTLSHYIQNRVAYSETHGISLGLPEHLSVSVRDYATTEERETDEKTFSGTIEQLRRENDIVIIDTPGSDGALFRTAHETADILISPINDSLLDLDVLAKVEPESLTVKAPGRYAQTVWRARQKRAAEHRPQMQWFVVRNRVMHVATRNEKVMWKLLTALGGRIGFTPLAGLGERIIYRELFLKGLTLLDLGGKNGAAKLSAAHLAARQELRGILAALGEDVSPLTNPQNDLKKQG